MTGSDAKDWLDDLVRNYPDRTSGEELQRFVSRQCVVVVRDHREALVTALTGWLDRRQEPYSMLAVKLAVDHRLSELREPITNLLSAVQGGTAFKPQLRGYYVTRLQEALAHL